MSIEELMENNPNQIIINLENVVTELRNLTLPLKRIINPKVGKKEEIFERIKELRLKTEDITKSMEEAMDTHNLRTIREITNKVKEIIAEKEVLKEELRNLDVKNKF